MMRNSYIERFFYARYVRAIAVISITVIFAAIFWASIASASSKNTVAPSQGERIVTVYSEGKKQVVLTKADTVRSVLEQADIVISDHDIVEPSLDAKIMTSDFTVNIYKAHPVMVVDGMRRQRILSPHSSPRDIAKDAGIELHDADIVTLTKPNDILAAGGGINMNIIRATPVDLVLYGKDTIVYTQAKTVAELLKEKNITLRKNDTLSVDKSLTITANMRIEVWRDGVQTVTQDEDVAFPIRQIQDADQPVGYKKVQTPGINGKKSVTYEVTMKNGQELSRKEIQSIVTEQPKEQVEVVGVKPSFSGDFAEALAKLRACEAGGNYANKNNPLYRGAYQFGYTTWGNKYNIYDPADATPAQQDQAARELYERRGWQPWPVCGEQRLPDIYR